MVCPAAFLKPLNNLHGFAGTESLLRDLTGSGNPAMRDVLFRHGGMIKLLDHLSGQFWGTLPILATSKRNLFNFLIGQTAIHIGCDIEDRVIIRIAAFYVRLFYFIFGCTNHICLLSGSRISTLERNSQNDRHF